MNIEITPAANDKENNPLIIGQPHSRIEEGRIYAGILPKTGKHISVLEKKSSPIMNHFDAASFALGQGGRLPSLDDRKILFGQERPQELSSEIPPNRAYWLSTNFGDKAWAQWGNKDKPESVGKTFGRPTIVVFDEPQLSEPV